MFEDLSEKFKKLKMPEESLIKKIEKIKKTSETTASEASAAAAAPDITEQLKQTQEEMTKKIEELVNSKSEQVNANTEAVKEFDVKLNKMESTVSASKQRIDEFKDRLDKIDESLLELLSLYEVVSSTVNPFVGDKDNIAPEKLEQIEKKIEVLSQKTPDIPQDMKNEFNNKFQTIENRLDALVQIIESTSSNQDALIQKVSEQVLDNLKPILDTQIEQLKVQQPQKSPPLPSPPTDKTVQPVQIPAPQYSENGNGAKLSYLDNRAETSIVLLNWIEFLLEKVGRNNLAEILDYYIEIGWINEEVSFKMMTYANGIDYYVERPTWKLLPEDHAKSLLFIEQLTGKKIDRNLLSRLERDVDKVIRSNEIYNF